MIKNIIAGMLAGGALGDALGAPHEFKCNKDRVYTGSLVYQPYRMRDSRWFKGDDRHNFGPLGCVTDDTNMTMILLRSLLRNGLYDRDDTLLSYMVWSHLPPRDMGNDTRYVFGNKTISGYNKIILRRDREIKSGIRDISLSNGALMRCTPFVLLPEDDTSWESDVNTTNPYSITRDANRLYLKLLRKIYKINLCPKSRLQMLTDQPTRKLIILKLIIEIDDPIVKDVARASISGKWFDVTINKGYVCNALWCALVCFHTGMTFSNSMNWVITQGGKTGKGDTDTNAAISGSIMGAMYGFEMLMLDPEIAHNWSILLHTAREEPEDRKTYGPHDFESLCDDAVMLYHTHHLNEIGYALLS